MIKKILTLGALVTALSLGSAGCKEDTPVQHVQRPRTRKPLVQKKEPVKKTKILTQIIDVQDAIVPYSTRKNIQTAQGDTGALMSQHSAVFRYLHVKGGDVEEEILILPKNSGFIKKYTPVEITYKSIPDKKIRLINLVRQQYGNVKGIAVPNSLVDAYGIVEPDGIKYIEGEKK